MHVGDKLQLIINPDNITIGYKHTENSKWTVTHGMKVFLEKQCKIQYTGIQSSRDYYLEAVFVVKSINYRRDGQISSIKLMRSANVSIWPPEIFRVIDTKHKTKPIKISFV